MSSAFTAEALPADSLGGVRSVAVRSWPERSPQTPDGVTANKDQACGGWLGAAHQILICIKFFPNKPLLMLQIMGACIAHGAVHSGIRITWRLRARTIAIN